MRPADIRHGKQILRPELFIRLINEDRNIANYAPPAWTADATIDVRGYLQPVSELMRDDADIVLISKSSNAIRYMHPVNDPLFSAHTIGGYQMEREGGNISYYHTDIPTTVLGCAQQVRSNLILLVKQC